MTDHRATAPRLYPAVIRVYEDRIVQVTVLNRCPACKTPDASADMCIFSSLDASEVSQDVPEQST
jgi:hypothetical protein